LYSYFFQIQQIFQTKKAATSHIVQSVQYFHSFLVQIAKFFPLI